MITELITTYNNYMETIFNNNEFLIGMVTTGLIGFLGFSIRWLIHFGIDQFKKHLTTTIEIDSTHEAYHKIMNYINQEKIIEKSRYLLLTNGVCGYERPVLGLGSGFQIMKLFGKYCWVYIKPEQNKERVVYKMWLTSLGRSHKVAKKLYEIASYNKENDITDVIVAGDGVYRQPKEYMRNRFYIEVEQEVYNLIKRFIENEEDYVSKNIPYKLGILLYGPPGTGKTSVIRALAGEFDYKICVVNSFENFDKVPTDEKTIIVIDEIDMLVGKRQPKKKNDKNDNNKKEQNAENFGEILRTFSLSDALKKLDGIVIRHGAIVIATTNYPEQLDDALLRHGRLGYKFEFGYIKPIEFESAVKKYYEKEYKLEGELKQCTSADLMGAYAEGLTYDEFLDRFVKKG
jgi:hypothetical protein